ncbi:hypothetical protein CRE_01534 [Caenorhabditis remanei]|uniref:Uncharacterized protein n=1 Tax=Caenorhabditis remanei TaxID=31234 RepID=E3LGB1_CAERE|nr:hypothetical protein CRE_01534 [Caenorhabditis remanei]
MRSAVIALLVFVAFSRSDFLLPFPLTEKFINFTAQLEKPTNNDTSCNLAQLNYCQYSFNQNFGLNSSVSYSNGSRIFETVQNYLNSNVTQLSKICRARANFYHCLGHTYYTCMNLHTRLESNNTDSSNGKSLFIFIQSYNHSQDSTTSELSVDSNGFVEEDIKKQSINGTTSMTFPPPLPTETASTPSIKPSPPSTSARKNISKCLIPHYLLFFRSVQQTGNCLNTVYSNLTGDASVSLLIISNHISNFQAGHYGCENFRYTFANACPGLKCTIGK